MPLDEFTARTAYETYTKLRMFLDGIEEQLKEYARKCPIDLGDGYVYGPAPGRRDLDGVVVHAVLTELKGADFAARATEPTTSQRLISDAIRQENPRGIKRELNALLDEITKRGGCKLRSEVRKWRPRRGADSSEPE
jgi:hypothetical protein